MKNGNDIIMDDMENKSNGTEKEEEQELNPSHELPEATESAMQMEELQKQVEQYKDLMLRKAAEFDNYKRRTEIETANIIKYASASLIEDLLPVIDDFERSLKHSREMKDDDALVKGLELIYQKLVRILESRGVKSFETVGREFNVEYHDAVMQMPRTNVPPHVVIEEVEKGYMIEDRVIRHAKVVVSSAPVGEESGTDESGQATDTPGK
jgi:molecular chaperone GrpE